MAENKNLKILVLQIGKIGDMILTTPLFSELKNLFPDARLSVLASRVNSMIPYNLSCVNNVYVYEKNPLKQFWLYRELKTMNFDYFIDIKEHYSATGLKIKSKVKYAKSMGYNNEKSTFDVNLKDYQKGPHGVELSTAPINYFTNNSFDKKVFPVVHFPEKIKDRYASYFKNVKQKHILVNISAGKESRCWDRAKWVSLIDKIGDDVKVVLIGHQKDERDIAYIKHNIEGDNVKHIHNSNILEAADILFNCDMVISPDTSIIHIASAFNKPVIGLYNNIDWNINKFAPLSDVRKIIVSKNAENLDTISADEVFKAYTEIIQKVK